MAEIMIYLGIAGLRTRLPTPALDASFHLTKANALKSPQSFGTGSALGFKDYRTDRVPVDPKPLREGGGVKSRRTFGSWTAELIKLFCPRNWNLFLLADVRVTSPAARA